MSAQTAIVIPVHNAVHQLPRCLDSLAWAPQEDAVVVVVDSGSTDGSRHWIEAHAPDVVVVDGDDGMWWTEAVEVGCRFAVRELGVGRLGLLNVDCTWDQLSFRAAEDAMRRHSAAIVCSRVQRFEDAATTFAGGVVRWSGMLALRGNAPSLREQLPSAWVAWCGGQGVLIDSRVYVQTGGFDSAAFPHYFGDSDFCFRAARHGAHVWYASGSTVRNDHVTSGYSPHLSGDLRRVWTTLTSRRSVFNVRDSVRFYVRHATWRSPLALVHLYWLWAAWSARGLLRRSFHV
jgi:GT2 family glycosyltransferase